MEATLKPDGLPGSSSGGAEQHGPTAQATLAGACASLGLTRTLFGGVKLRFVSDLEVGEVLRAEDSTESARLTQSTTNGLMAIITTVRRVFSGHRLVLEQWQTDVVRGALAADALW